MKNLGPVSHNKDVATKEYVDSVGGGVELTKAQYDALTPAEKMNGKTYYITDGGADSDVTIINDSVPIGAIQAYGGDSAPYGWLICDGSAVSRTTYFELFSAIGTTYGSGDGSTTFNLPDLKGRVLIGESSEYDLGDFGGEATHKLTVNEMPKHDHQQYVTANSGSEGIRYDYNADANTSRYPQCMTGYAGGDQPHNNMQPYLVGNYIIKAKNEVNNSSVKQFDPQGLILEVFYPVGSYYETSDESFNPNSAWGGTWLLETEGQVHVSAGSNYEIGDTGGEATHKLTVDEMPSHSHNYYFDYNSNVDWGIGLTASSAQPDRSAIASGPTGRAYTLNIRNTGGSQSHNNMQPYIVVNRWHRVA